MGKTALEKLKELEYKAKNLKVHLKILLDEVDKAQKELARILKRIKLLRKDKPC
jgi:hypothetical protein